MLDKSLRIGISGSRKRYSKEDREKVRAAIESYANQDPYIVHGGNPKGIDYLANKMAAKLDLRQIIIFPGFLGAKLPDEPYLYHARHGEEVNLAHYFNWNAGAKLFLARNLRIIEEVEFLIAFPENVATAARALEGEVVRGGTNHAIRHCAKAGKKVIIVE